MTLVTITSITTITHSLSRHAVARRLPPPPVVGRSYPNHVAAMRWRIARQSAKYSVRL